MGKKNDNAIFKVISSTCEAHWNPDITLYLNEILNNAKNNIRERPVEESELEYPVCADEKHTKEWLVPLSGSTENLRKSNLFAKIINGYWIGIAILAAISKFSRSTSLIKGSHGKHISSLKGRILLPRSQNKHATPFGFEFLKGLLTTRMESLIISIYVVLHLLALSYSYDFDRAKFVGHMREQSLLFPAERAGILAFAQFPLIILSGSRNIIFSWLTG
ncbi:AEL_HP2_G0025690.mRNA.1.CDS.1 [Saccharomyces cerevisiae]|nr:AEL_HP2_G0025690.mRNA.1.CDS.1 [Saccharomyces cerevisiae]CAI6459812.1 AEL_HP2_G0025690.mRNA.1.CDS.1 [Saccharomyces cerevisiae]